MGGASLGHGQVQRCSRCVVDKEEETDLSEDSLVLLQGVWILVQMAKGSWGF